jgi:hypothetical protein
MMILVCVMQEASLSAGLRWDRKRWEAVLLTY